ncbi:hypothetical protein [Phenylobacterium sp.]|uniref:hypothetical protein n=1 Tax=Phenylobacterium sp. TaxID=1871053 RepID=UPI002C7B54EB|nr:hypothetical protein [Phenylobacterium sp.]HLZ73518.1 hypothetical protein [Phenylobacterium sp.]
MPKSVAYPLSRTAAVTALLDAAGLTQSSIIRVTGEGALVALLWLRRHGYDHVGYGWAGADAPRQEPDAILVTHTCDEIALKRLLAVGRQVRPGGVFIFRHRLESEGCALGIEWLLDQAGFATERRLTGAHRGLVIARRRSLAMCKAA